MRAAFVLASLLAFALAIPQLQLKQQRQQINPVGEEFQIGILRLFENINNKYFFSDQVEVGNSYDIEANIGNYIDPQVVKDFLEIYRGGVLPQGEVFSIFYGRQQKQAVALYRLLYNANDLSTLYKTAAWARLNINEGMFIYALSVAIVQRPDTTNVVLPPIYEIYPNFFFDAEVIQQAQLARQSLGGLPEIQPLNVRPELSILRNQLNQQKDLPWSMQQMPITGMQGQLYPSQTPISWAKSSQQSDIGQRLNTILKQLNQQSTRQEQPWIMKKISGVYGVQQSVQNQLYPQMIGKWQKSILEQQVPRSGLSQFNVPGAQSPNIDEELYGNQLNPQLLGQQQQQQQNFAELYGQQPQVWWKKSTPYGKVPIRQGLIYGQQSIPQAHQSTQQQVEEQLLLQQLPQPVGHEQWSNVHQIPISGVRPAVVPGVQSNIGQGVYGFRSPLNPQLVGQGLQQQILQQELQQLQQQQLQLQQLQQQQQQNIPELNRPQPPSWWKQSIQQEQVPIRQGLMYGQQPKPQIYQNTQQQVLEQLLPQLQEQQQLYLQQNDFVGITIDSNVSSRYVNNVEQQMMAYFTEDIGLNALYYYYNIYYPFWLSSDELSVQSQRRGEQFYYIYQQLLARFYLERLSNGLGEIPNLEYSKPIPSGYYPTLSYPNGLSFPGRPNDFMRQYQPQNSYSSSKNYSNSYTFVEDYERRIRDAIDLGYIYSESGKLISLYQPEGIELLGSIIEGNPDSPQVRFYGTLQILARYLLGNSRYPHDQYRIAPSVLEQFETSLRDPVFYQFYKRIVAYFQQYKSNQPNYMREDLVLPGVRVQSVEIDPLITYFDEFYTNINNALQSTGVNDVNVRVRQPRLNNKPFTYTISVYSEQPVDSIVKVFIGPKYDENGIEMDLMTNRLNFVEIDKFPVSLTSGVNSIQRSSLQSYYPSDRVTYKQLYMDILKGKVAPEPIVGGLQWVIPKRLLLPKGTKQGQMYQLFVMLTPQQWLKEQQSRYTKQNIWGQISDSLPLGYPFDKEIDDSVSAIPNSYMRDIVIYNVNVDDITLRV